MLLLSFHFNGQTGKFGWHLPNSSSCVSPRRWLGKNEIKKKKKIQTSLLYVCFIFFPWLRFHLVVPESCLIPGTPTSLFQSVCVVYFIFFHVGTRALTYVICHVASIIYSVQIISESIWDFGNIRLYSKLAKDKIGRLHCMWEKIISHIAYVVEEDWSWKLSWAENKRKS